MCACPQEHVAAQNEKNVTGKSLKKVHKLHSLVSWLRCAALSRLAFLGPAFVL